MSVNRPLLGGLHSIVISSTLGPRLIWTCSCQSLILELLAILVNRHIVFSLWTLVNRHDVIFCHCSKSLWRHPCIKRFMKIPFSLINSRRSRRQLHPLLPLLTPLFLRLLFYSTSLINKTGAPSISPLSYSHRLPSRDPKTSSIVAAAVVDLPVCTN